MNYTVGIDLGSTTTKAVVLGEDGAVLGRGITNSRSNYDVACQVALSEALINTRFSLIAGEFQGIARDPAHAPVLVGIDGSPTSELATAIAFDEASRRHVDLIALHAVEEGGLFRRFWDSIRLFFFNIFN